MSEITTSHLTNSKGGGATSFLTASVTPRPGELVVVTVLQNMSPGTPNEPTISGCGLTFEKIVTVVNSIDSSQRVTSFRAMGDAPTAGQITIDCGGQTQTSIFWSVDLFANVNRSLTEGEGGIVQSTSKSENNGDPMSMTLTLSTFGDAKNATFAAMIGPDTIATPSGFSAIFSDDQDLGPDNNVKAVFKAGNSTSTVFTSTGGGANVATGIAFEIRYRKPSGGGFL